MAPQPATDGQGALTRLEALEARAWLIRSQDMLPRLPAEDQVKLLRAVAHELSAYGPADAILDACDELEREFVREDNPWLSADGVESVVEQRRAFVGVVL